ncbi:MAG TPA: YhbY family RNA-binding protein [Burkholderiales bacterium]|nr:YhbY family RNA-binding protein [Burkholderiales bacterium]
MKELDPAERRALRARAHALHPVVTIGNAGLKPEVIGEIEAHLKVHDLMKIRARGDEREVRKGLISEICEATGAQPVQSIGKILVIYRELPPETEKKAVKRRPRPKPPRRTKRSFQKA